MGRSRQELAARLDEVSEGRSGRELVDAVKRLADGLDEEEREELGRLLLERAAEEGSFDYGLIRRISEPYLQLFRPRPVEPGREPRRRRRWRRRGDGA